MTRINILFFPVLISCSLSAVGQVGVAYDLVKPPKYENRTLASEKSTEGKFRIPRHFIQNTVTHYNFYFNANNKLNEVIARAKAQTRDDYTRLLPFYNFNLEATALQKRDLDSVIFKCTTGILVHDTRNDWIDNLYLLIGKAYYFRRTFDSAYITFQFLNYAFAPKESDGYDKPIGSNANRDEGGNANIVSTKEKPNIAQKIFSLPPSRNDALVWQVRTFLEQNKYPEAAALIAVLKNDPQFPGRLGPSLEEVQALWFYKQSIYDSAAYHLTRALPVAASDEERARWEYLIGQLYERANDHYLAKTFYERTVKHTYNPVLDVYARLNAIRQSRDSSADYIQKNIDALVKMARKDRYESYRDIIYYMAAQIELERNHRPGAETDLLKCVHSAEGEGSGSQRNKAFLQLANLSFEDRKYKSAKSYYDSVNTIDQSLGDLNWLHDRKIALSNIVSELAVIERQDSLQRIAGMPPNERDAYIKRLVRALRRQRGLRDDEQQEENNNVPAFANNGKTPPPDLFSSSASGSGEWYFYNPSLKSKGYSDFKTKWGNRPNVDNWQLTSLISQQKVARPGERTAASLTDPGNKGAAPPAIDFKTLMDNLPLTPEKMKKSQDSVERAMFSLGKALQEGLSDYHSAINAYDSLLVRIPNTSLREETLFNLYYCYTKVGDQANADRVLQEMKAAFPSGKFTATAINPDSAARASVRVRTNATLQYEKIYSSFIEGRFDEALLEKRQADSLYGSAYWTPQLLYIEAVYFIHSRQDEEAKRVLNNIVTKFPSDPMATKAARLIDVVSRRRQIENYLTNLKIERAGDSVDLAASVDSVNKHPQPGPRTVVAPPRYLIPRDSTQKNLPPRVNPSDSGQLARGGRNRLDSIQSVGKRKADSLQAITKLAYTYTPEKQHAVMMIMTKVDPVYVNEAKNAFTRYNMENFYGLQLRIENLSLNDSVKMMVVDSFANAAAALDYMNKARALAPRQILPWLPPATYVFVVISETNLDLLLRNKDAEAYKKFLVTVYPVKF
ncbi:MAG: hypothetical protein Q8932_18100 [Bacteroidota bacterium]|nr:hypothetical protein [Bacteroidota bacterium]